MPILRLAGKVPRRRRPVNSATRASPRKSNTDPAVIHREAMDHGMRFDST